MYVCLWSPAWSIDGASGGEDSSAAGLALVDLAPRLRIEREAVWADGRGLDARALAVRLLTRLAEDGVTARAGVAAIPVAAELAARWGPVGEEAPTPFLVKERTGWGWRRSMGRGSSRPVGPASGVAGPAGDVEAVEPGTERAWLATLPMAVLAPDARLGTLLDGVGIQTLGELASLDREAVEVRLGAPAVSFWRLARADDRRLLFGPVPPERPHGSIDFVDYVLTDPARLLFTANALLGPLCDRLAVRGEHARALRLVFPLANGEAWERTLRPARPTASRESWLRMVRGLLDRLTVPDAVTGMLIEVGATEPAAVRQGDLFDRGFATAAAVEAAVARLVERQVAPLAPRSNGHPLAERRIRWEPLAAERVAPGGAGRTGSDARDSDAVGLSLQLLPEPRRLLVDSVPRRDHEAPVRLRDRGGWRDVVMAAGPDRISGGRWEVEPYAREYFRCVTDEGVLLWVYRDARSGGWYLHGWWD
jgi:protein ImuB